MLPNEKLGCHHTGFTKKCRKLVADGICGRWTQIIGVHPQTGEQLNRWDCVDNFTALLLVENAQMSRQTAASVDKSVNEARGFRNDMRAINGVPELSVQEQPKMIEEK